LRNKCAILNIFEELLTNQFSDRYSLLRISDTNLYKVFDTISEILCLVYFNLYFCKLILLIYYRPFYVHSFEDLFPRTIYYIAVIQQSLIYNR